MSRRWLCPRPQESHNHPTDLPFLPKRLSVGLQYQLQWWEVLQRRFRISAWIITRETFPLMNWRHISRKHYEQKFPLDIKLLCKLEGLEQCGPGSFLSRQMTGAQELWNRPHRPEQLTLGLQSAGNGLASFMIGGRGVLNGNKQIRALTDTEVNSRQVSVQCNTANSSKMRSRGDGYVSHQTCQKEAKGKDL